MVVSASQGNAGEGPRDESRLRDESLDPDRSHARAGLAVGLAQAALLVALVAVPLLANPHSSRGFQEDRTIVLRLLGYLGLAVLLFRPGQVRQLGLAGLGVGLYLLVSALSAALSLEPSAAWPGAYLRQGGFQTDLGLAGLFLAASTLAAWPARTELALKAVLLGGAASSLLAIAQAAGLDVPFVADESRAFAFTGGPTFLGSFLAILLPISLARVRGVSGLPTALLLAAGLLSTASRVALVAALVGAALIGIWSGRKRLVLWTGAVLLGIALLFATPICRGMLPHDSLPNRLVSGVLGEQVGERSLIYRDAVRALGKRSDRLLVGRGPDSIGTLFTAEISEELQGRLGGKTRIDRLHSDPLDLIYTRGLLAPIALLLMFAGSLFAARRKLRGASGGDRAITLGLAACLVTNLLDGALSVPGSGSRLMLFFAAGWLAGRSFLPQHHEGRPRQDSDFIPGIFVGTGLAVILFGANDPRHLWIGMPLLLLLRGRPVQVRALFAAAAVLLPFLMLRLSLDPTGGGEFTVLPSTLADRARLTTCSLLLLLGLVTLVVAVLLHGQRSPSRSSAKVIRASLAALGLLLFAVSARYDVARLIADVNARVALDVQIGGGEPARAAALLDEAIEWAPEVAEYRKLKMIVCTDEAQGGKGRNPVTLREQVGRQVGDILDRHPNDAYALAQSARCLLEFGRLIPTETTGMNRRAWKVAEQALRVAPTATPVLHVAAETLIELGEAKRADELLDQALRIDRTQTRALLLRGRARAAMGDLAGASEFYGLAYTAGAGTNECLAALVIAAGATGRVDDAATLVLLLSERVPVSPRLEQDVAGARPLLHHLADTNFRELFNLAAERRTADPNHLAKVHAVLKY